MTLSLPTTAGPAHVGDRTRTATERLRHAFYYLYISCLLGTNAVVLIPRTISGTGSNGIFVVSWLIMLALSMFFLTTVRRQNGTNLMIALGVGYLAVASTVWSVRPGITLVYASMMAGNILVAHMMANEFRLIEIIRMVGRTILFLSAAGIVAYFVGYDQVVYLDSHVRPNLLGGQPLRGFFPHKIMGSLYAVIGLIAVLSSMRGRQRLLGVVVLSWFVLLTGSATGVTLLVLAAAIHAATTAVWRRSIAAGTVFLWGALGVIAVGLSLWLGRIALLTMLDRDITLTGRTILWEWGIRTWSDRPILGWGFNAYLRSEQASIINLSVPAFRDYEIAHFHQSFIQTAADLGAVGLALLVGVLLYTLAKAYRIALRDNDPAGITAFTMVAVLLVASLTMYLFLTYNHFATWLLFVLFFACRRIWHEPPTGRRRRRRTPRDSHGGAARQHPDGTPEASTAGTPRLQAAGAPRAESAERSRPEYPFEPATQWRPAPLAGRHSQPRRGSNLT